MEGQIFHVAEAALRDRGTITGSDWRRVDPQAAYWEHFSPFIQRRIDLGGRGGGMAGGR